MIQIIPAIDLIEGKCVRLTQGDYSQKKVYNENPLEVAKEFEDAGIRRLHLVDLDGAKAKKIVNYKTLEEIAGKTRLTIDFGGGLQSDKDLEIAFGSGAAQVTGGSVAVKNPEMFLRWLEVYGGEKIILGSDSKDGKIAVSGWEETSSTTVFELLDQYTQAGVLYTISTDVAKDGLLQGTSVELYKSIQKEFPALHLIASGGVSKMADIGELDSLGIYGVIVGKAIYENRITLQEIQKYHAN